MASKGGIGIWDLPPVKKLSITIFGSCLFMIYMDIITILIYKGSLFDMVYIFFYLQVVLEIWT